jgi:hypothetical protein
VEARADVAGARGRLCTGLSLRKDPALSHGFRGKAKSWDQAARRRGPVRSGPKVGWLFLAVCVCLPGASSSAALTCAWLMCCAAPALHLRLKASWAGYSSPPLSSVLPLRLRRCTSIMSSTVPLYAGHAGRAIFRTALVRYKPLLQACMVPCLPDIGELIRRHDAEISVYSLSLSLSLSRSSRQ